MEGFQPPGMGKKLKSYRNFPLRAVSILARKGQRVKTYIIHIFCQKWPILIMILVLRSYFIKSLFKNCVRKMYFKKLQKSSDKQHQKLFTCEIIP